MNEVEVVMYTVKEAWNVAVSAGSIGFIVGMLFGAWIASPPTYRRL